MRGRGGAVRGDVGDVIRRAGPPDRGGAGSRGCDARWVLLVDVVFPVSVMRRMVGAGVLFRVRGGGAFGGVEEPVFDGGELHHQRLLPVGSVFMAAAPVVFRGLCLRLPAKIRCAANLPIRLRRRLQIRAVVAVLFNRRRHSVWAGREDYYGVFIRLLPV